jgi:hypothetical protein
MNRLHSAGFAGGLRGSGLVVYRNQSLFMI